MYVAETSVGFTPVLANGESRFECLNKLVSKTEELVNWKEDAKINVTVKHPDNKIKRVKIKVAKYK